jgi:hypothetical protein
MSYRNEKIAGTSLSIGKWDTAQNIRRIAPHAETTVQPHESVYLVQAQPAEELSVKGFAIVVTPAVVTRKLAIRKLNGEVEGWTAQSNTAVSKSAT